MTLIHLQMLSYPPTWIHPHALKKISTTYSLPLCTLSTYIIMYTGSINFYTVGLGLGLGLGATLQTAAKLPSGIGRS